MFRWCSFKHHRIRPVKATATLTLATVLTGSLAACSSDSSDGHTSTNADKPLVLTTFTILEDMTSQIAGDSVDVQSITDPGAEIHGYEPTPSDIAHASDADLILTNGLGLEHWVDKLLTHASAERVTVTDGINPIPIAGSSTANPHAWMSPKLAKIYVDNIVEALGRIAPESRDTFATNASRYKNQIDQVDHTLTDGLSKLPKNKRTLVTCEGAFSYLTREANMQEGYIWPVNSDGEVTSGQVLDAAKLVKDNHVPSVFCESTVERGPHEQLMRETGAADGGTLYVDSLSPTDGPVPTFLDLISYDVDTIVKGLNK